MQLVLLYHIATLFVLLGAHKVPSPILTHRVWALVQPICPCPATSLTELASHSQSTCRHQAVPAWFSCRKSSPSLLARVTTAPGRMHGEFLLMPWAGGRSLAVSQNNQIHRGRKGKTADDVCNWKKINIRAPALLAQAVSTELQEVIANNSQVADAWSLLRNRFGCETPATIINLLKVMVSLTQNS